MAEKSDATREWEDLRQWAASGVEDKKLADRVSKLVDWAWENPHRRKSQATIRFLKRIGNFKNLPNAVQSLKVKGRVKSSKLESCRGCGTKHRDSYHFQTSKGEKGKRDIVFGVNCTKRYLVSTGLNAGLLEQADQKRAQKIAKQRSSELERLVETNERMTLLYSALDRAKPAGRDFVGNHLNWLAKQNLSKKVEEALERMRDPHHRHSKKDSELVWNEIDRRREFPADKYAPVADDIELMGATKAAERLRQHKYLTNAKVHNILRKHRTNHIKFRRRKNNAALRSYDTTLHEIIHKIMPAFISDRQKLGKDMKEHLRKPDKILSKADYKAASYAVRRWMFDKPQQIEDKSSQQRLRNIAIAIESVNDFRGIVSRLVQLQRKFDYCNEHKFGALDIRTPCIPSENEPDIESMISAAGRTYTFNRKIREVQETLPDIINLAKYRLIREADLHKLKKAEMTVKKRYASVVALSDSEMEAVNYAQELAATGLVESIDGLPNLETLAGAVWLEKDALKAIISRKSLLRKTKGLVCPEGKINTENIRKMVEEIEAKALNGYELLDGFDLRSLETREMPVNFKRAEKGQAGRRTVTITYTSPTIIQHTYHSITQGLELFKTDTRQKWAAIRQAHEEGVLYDSERKTSGFGYNRQRVWERRQLLDDRAVESIDRIVNQPEAVKSRIIVAPQAQRHIDEAYASIPARYAREQVKKALETQTKGSLARRFSAYLAVCIHNETELWEIVNGLGSGEWNYQGKRRSFEQAEIKYSPAIPEKEERAKLVQNALDRITPNFWAVLEGQQHYFEEGSPNQSPAYYLLEEHLGKGYIKQPELERLGKNAHRLIMTANEKFVSWNRNLQKNLTFSQN